MLPFIHKPFELLASRLGASPDELKLVFSFLISYPLAGLLKRVPDSRPDLKNLFIISTSTFYLVGLFDLWDGVRTLAIASAGIYSIAKYLRTSPFMPWVGFTFLMGHMSISHIARQVANSPSSIDITGAQMVLLMKLSGFCWNVADGQLPDDQVSEYQKERRLIELPSIMDYAGYVLFFPSLFAGPAFDYTDYRKWLDTTMFDLPAKVDPSKKPPVRKKRKIPRSGTPATLKAASGLGWISLFMVLSGYYPITYLTSPSYMNHGFFHRVWILHMVGFTARLKYYGVWCLTEGACILAGLGYNGVDHVTGKVSWNRLQNINPWGVETAQNTRAYLGNWNINTNNWLRNYVYLRVTPIGKKPGFRASLLTFSTSALWHGFYPGYYMSFILASFIQTVAKNYRRYFRAFFLDANSGAPTPNKVYYDVLSLFVTQIGMSFVVSPFLVLEFSGSVQVWARVYFYTIVGTVLSMAFFASPAKQVLRKQLEARQGKGGARLTRTLSQDSLSGREPVLGVSPDLQREIDEAMEEIKAEVEARQRSKAA
ncbi:MBOAT family protein [Colletotrichum orchidophilum]|uniref:MBOAT family protein n=1 Tax=Colletotrichum orchidophilum TaxID=1209926 RepID=A0A1G4BGM5_9PEZI|nr:MBOAT family protein [Colletotrichum orchidophilum]OHF00541.1 MBOAT family protein [Colletotrichum orchidophilum]